MTTIRTIARSLYRAMPLKRPLFELLRRGPQLPQRAYQHLHFDGPFTVRIDDSHQFRINSYGDQVENDLFWAGFGGHWEATSLRVWATLCRSRPGLILDIGANTGVYALAGSAISGGHAVAFEPLARIAKRLAYNVALNGLPIAVEQKAVSDRSGALPIYDTMVPHNYSASLEGQGSDAQRYDVEVTTIDDYLAGLGNPPVGPIKIDVERHEPAVLRGMKSVISSQRPPMLIEILDEAIGESVAAAVAQFDYGFHRIDEGRGLVPANRLLPAEQESRNFLICTARDFEGAGLMRYLVD